MLLLLAVLGVASARALREVAALRASALRQAIALELESFREHARFLAGLAESEIAGYLTHFRGLARVRIHDASGRCTLHAERFGYLVANLPPARLEGPPEMEAPPEGIAESGFLADESRLDVEPALRQVIRFATRRGDGGTLVLTAYAAPFLAPLRGAGAHLARAEEPARWQVVVPVAWRGAALYAALGVGIVLLAASALLFSERQLRVEERARLERQIAQEDRLRALGVLAAGIAHEINNPLEGIANWLRLGNLDKVQEGLDRIRAIARELLAFARPDAGGEHCDVRAALDRALELARLGFRDAETEARVEGRLQARIAPRMLEQVFLNILLNAGAAMRGVERPRMEIDAVQEGAKVRIRFRDHGGGISPEDLPRLFDPFFSRSGGTGLGLSVSYGILSAVGGSLSAANAEGGGAVFTVEVPAT